MKAAIASVLLAVAASLAFLLLRGGNDDANGAARGPKGEQPAVSGNRKYGADVVLAIRPGAPATTGRKATTRNLSPLMQEFQDAKALRPLHDRLRGLTSRSAEEDYLLASILEACATVTDRKPPRLQRDREADRKNFVATVSERDPKAQARIAAYDKSMRNRCEGFEGVTTTMGEVGDLLKHGDGDPKAQARLIEKEVATTLPDEPFYKPDGKSNLPRVTDEQLEALRQVVRSGDPIALQIAARVFGTSMQDLRIRTGANDEDIDMRVWYDAWRLVGCDAGLACGAESGSLLAACAYQGNCGAGDLREHLFFFDHSPQQSQRLAEYHDALTRAIQTGDWSYFNFYRGPGPRNFVTIRVSK